MSKGVLHSVRQAIDYNEERARERVKSAREEIANLPDLLRERQQLKRWQKRANALRQADFTFVVMLFPSVDSSIDPGKRMGRSVFVRSKGKLEVLMPEAGKQFLKLNAESKYGISMMLSRCSVELRGGLRIDLPSDLWLPLLGDGVKEARGS